MARSLPVNTISNIIQVVAGTIILFILFKYINVKLGVATLGVWSVIISAASASRLADLGLSSGITRFVARYLALKSPENAAQIIETALIVLSGSAAVILISILPILEYFVKFIFIGDQYNEAVNILPAVLISVWLSLISTINLNGLEGCQLIMEKAIIVVAGQIIMLLSVFALVPRYDLLGLAYAQIVQGVFLLIVSWIILKRHIKALSIIPYKFKRDKINEMIIYGANVQIGNLSILLIDPLTKTLIAKFGGAEAAGLFEIANQIVVRVRTLFGAANQAIVPVAANYNELHPNKIKKLYINNLRVVMLISIPCYTVLLYFSWLFSQIFFNEINNDFEIILTLSIICWFLNTLAGPAYFINFGTGSIKFNTITYLSISMTNLIFGYMLGLFYGMEGVVIAYVASICIGSIYLIININLRLGVSWGKIINENKILIFACMALWLVKLFYKFNIEDYSELSIGIGQTVMAILFLALILSKHNIFSIVKKIQNQSKGRI